MGIRVPGKLWRMSRQVSLDENPLQVGLVGFKPDGKVHMDAALMQQAPNDVMNRRCHLLSPSELVLQYKL
eukprot:1143257-Pelagomonas_calceolata.AAC.12